MEYKQNDMKNIQCLIFQVFDDANKFWVTVQFIGNNITDVT